MDIKELNNRVEVSVDKKLSTIYSEFKTVLNELKTKDLKPSIQTVINEGVDEINDFYGSEAKLGKFVVKKQAAILKQIEKEHKIVPKNRYRNIWMLSGMSAFGLPIGVVFGQIMGNMGLMGLGLPIGMAIGLAVGVSLDKKALKEGRQLQTEIKNLMY